MDPQRTIIFGHTTTTKVGKANGGDIAYSTFDNELGKPAWIAIDVGAYNHISPGLAAIDIATLEVIKQPTLRSDRWFEVDSKPVKFFPKLRKKKSRWKHPDNRKESHAADSFGLIALRQRSKKNLSAENKVREDLNRIGVIIPSKDAQINSELSRPFTWRKLARRAMEDYTNVREIPDEWTHNGHLIRLGPGTESSRFPPKLPGPNSFPVYSRVKKKDMRMKILVEEKSRIGRA